MSTYITNKQLKIQSKVNFNNNAIENSIIDASQNEIENLTTSNLDDFNDIYNGIIDYIDNSIIDSQNTIYDFCNDRIW